MFIVMEIQTNGEEVGTIINKYSDINQAKSKYHTILAAAAVSSVERHAACVLDDKGRTLWQEAYDHVEEQ